MIKKTSSLPIFAMVDGLAGESLYMEYNLRQLQLAELQILKDVAKMCDENNIYYYLDSGTLLGAVRHKGFIPWDDDVDIIMDTENYKKFCKLAPTVLSDTYFVQNIDTDKKIHISWGKVRKNGTTCMEKNFTNYDVHYGIGIDIFILIGAPKTSLGRKVWECGKMVQDILLEKHCCEARGDEVSRLWLLLWKIPEKMRLSLIHFLQNRLMISCDNHDKVLNMWYKSPQKYAVPATTYDKNHRVKLPFEDTELWCPADYEEVLRTYYGEWQLIPSKEEQETHGDMIVDFEKDYKTYYTGK